MTNPASEERTVAVTGACGFVGANVALHLARSGRRVLACDLDAPPAALADAWSAQGHRIRWVSLDVVHDEGWSRLDSHALDVIIHGAAITPGRDDAAPGRTLRVNLCGTVGALEYAVRRQCRRFVFISSSGIYGSLRSRRPLSEALAVRPTRPYAVSKLAAEACVSLYRRAHGLDACSVRLGAQYGPWERPTASRSRMTPILRLVTAALRGERVAVAGAGISREWTYVEDVAAGLAHLATLPQVPFDLLNLSSGVSATLEDVIGAIRELLPETAITLSKSPKADIVLKAEDHRAPLDVSRLRQTGFVAATDLQKGLRLYIDWLRGPGRFLLNS